MEEKDRKRTVYVGGLADQINEDILHAAFIPFGEIKDVSIPVDHSTQKHRGFGFVQFEELEDAAAAIDNMHNAELYEKVLTCNIAKPQKIKLGYSRPVWADADDWYEKQLKDDGLGASADANDAGKKMLERKGGGKGDAS